MPWGRSSRQPNPALPLPPVLLAATAVTADVYRDNAKHMVRPRRGDGGDGAAAAAVDAHARKATGRPAHPDAILLPSRRPMP